MKNFYSNIGNKLQTIAKICGVIGLVCACIGLLAMLLTAFDDEGLVVGIACIIAGIGALVGSWPLYAFGQLVNDVHSIKMGANKEEAFEDFELPEI